MEGLATQIKLDDIDCLWLRLKEGDRNGLEGIYRNFSPALFQYGLSLVPDQDYVQDCIQEVFIDIWKYHKNLQAADIVKMYLVRSLSHKIYREIKKNKKWKKEGRMDHMDICSFTESKESEIISIQRDEILQKKLALALLKLPNKAKGSDTASFF